MDDKPKELSSSSGPNGKNVSTTKNDLAHKENNSNPNNQNSSGNNNSLTIE